MLIMNQLLEKSDVKFYAQFVMLFSVTVRVLRCSQKQHKYIYKVLSNHQ